MNLYRLLGLSLLFLSPCLASSDSVVVFNEIMYHPASDEESEWIELHNQMAVDIDLSRWSLEGGVDFDFPEGTIIPGGGYLVIAANPDAVENALGPFTGRLDNGGETLRLKSASDRLMNRLRYRDGGDWPVGPDGSGATLAKVHRDSAAPDAANWSWSAETGGTPGAVNFPKDTVPYRDLRINEAAGESEAGFWIELVNAGDAELSLEGHVLLQSTTGVEHVLDAGSLGSGATLLLGAETFPGGAASGDLLFLYSPDKKSLVDAIEVKTRSRGRFPDGNGDLVFTSEETPNAPNVLAFHDDVVINEILYHHRPQYRTDDLPFKENDEEWIELYHRGDTPVDLSGWELDGDISYVFPQGTMLNPGAYVVIESGNGETGFDDNLPNGSGHVELVDAHGNIVDEVSYFDDGDWPKVADGGGSSLELRDPRADNANSQAWAPSDESARTQWQEIRYRGVAERSRVGPDNQWREFIVGLLDRGEILIDDIRVVEDPDGRKISLINNSAFQSSIFGGGPLRNWRLRGNHRHSEIVPDPEDPDNNVLRLVATGGTEHMHNHVEITFSGGGRVTNGETYEISYRARPVGGSPQVLTRLYFNRLAKTTILETPSSTGTPGAPNSRLVDNIGPTLSAMAHAPAVPTADEPCVISVQAADPDGVTGLKLFWSLNGSDFSEQPMATDDGRVYTASVPPQDADAVVQFYVEASDGQGAVSHYPKEGFESGALYQVLQPDRLDEGRLNPMRIIMTPSHTEWLHETINLMSNDRLPATVIYKEKEIFYNAGVRLKGSERGRVTTPRLGFNVKFPTQQRFRGTHRTVAIDRSEGVNFGQFEILFNQMMTHSGAIPAEYNDLIHVISPQDRHTGAAELQLARYGDIFLDSQFEDGSEGDLYEYELIYYPTTDDADGYKRPQPDSVVGSGVRDQGDDQEDYRWLFLLKNNRKRDNFAPIMEYAKLFSKSNDAFHEALPDLVDVDRWLQGMALALLSGSGDQYGANSQHNGMFYQRPDGKFIFFPHDLDFAHNASRSITENTDLRKILQNPAYERMYLAHVHNIIATTFNETYMTRWANHFGELLPGQNFNAHLNYVITRSKNAKSQVNRMAPQTSFKILTEGGPDFVVDTLSAEVEGTGALNLHRLIHVETGDKYTPEWLDLETWRINLTLQPGENVFTLQGVDVLGSTGSIFAPVGRGEITVTSTADPQLGEAQAVRGLEVTLQGETNLILSFERAVEEGLTVTPEISGDLESWSALSGATETVQPLADDDAYEAVTIRFEIEPGNSDFLRLKINRE